MTEWKERVSTCVPRDRTTEANFGPAIDTDEGRAGGETGTRHHSGEHIPLLYNNTVQSYTALLSTKRVRKAQ